MTFTQKYRFRYFIIIAILLIVIISMYVIYIMMTTESTDNAYIDGDISFISPQVSGIIDKIYFRDNSYVNSGELLAQINDNKYKNRSMQAKILLDISTLDLELSNQEFCLHELEIQKLGSALISAKVDFEVAKNNYNRSIKLKKGNFTSEKVLENAKSALESSKAKLKKINLDLQSANTQLKILEIKKNLAAANMSKAQSVYNEASLIESYTKIVAPVSGIIANNNLKLGAFVREGTAVLAIVNGDNIYLKANFKETQAAKILPKMKAEILIDGFPKTKILGRVRSVYPATNAKFSLIPSDNATGNFVKVVQRVPVLIDFIIPSKLKEKIVIGMSASVKVFLK